MSTLSIPVQRRTSEPASTASLAAELDARFEALTRAAAVGVPSTEPFETVFDLDYGQHALESAAATCPAPRVRVRRIRPTTRTTAPARRRTAVRLTRRGRTLLVLAFLGAALALTLPLSGWATATLEGGTPEPVRVVEVQPGDTLYGIAGEVAAPGEVREMVHRIQDLNSLSGSTITEGQTLAIPVG